MMEMQIPEILNIPPKIIDFLKEFNDFDYFLLEGGRGSGKSQSVARWLLYVAEHRKVRICCGRELQNNIDESVKTILADLILQYNLNFTVKDKVIIHNETGSVFLFKGFREQGKVNIKGLEGVDILWIDEAEAITKPTLDTIIPTIRKKNSKIIFTMNRFVRNDAVYSFCSGHPQCKHITVNYFDNPFLDEKLYKEAERCKQHNLKDYNHIWLGHPLDQASDFLVSSSMLDRAKTLKFNDETFEPHSVMSVDLSASGGDLCVAKLLTQQSISGWFEQHTETWSQPDTDITRGRIISLYAQWKPSILIIDADGLGYPIWNSVKKSIPDAIGFRGASKAKNLSAKNARADGYLAVKNFLESGWLKLTCENAIRQLEYIKIVHEPSGKIKIMDKKEIRKDQAESPDFSDTLMMAVYAISYHSHLFSTASNLIEYQPIINDNESENPFEY